MLVVELSPPAVSLFHAIAGCLLHATTSATIAWGQIPPPTPNGEAVAATMAWAQSLSPPQGGREGPLRWVQKYAAVEDTWRGPVVIQQSLLPSRWRFCALLRGTSAAVSTLGAQEEFQP